VNDQLLEFLVIAALALAVTFVLFRYLDAYAEGKARVLGDTIRYGGALGGFVIVVIVLVQLYEGFVRQMLPGETTEIDLDGVWIVQQTTSDGTVLSGRLTIEQRPGDARLEISGEVEDTKDDAGTQFSSLVGRLNGKKLFAVYEAPTAAGPSQFGLLRGTVVGTTPKELVLRYEDIASTDANDDTRGTLALTRRDPPR
jgi:hypothetical protein